MQRSSRRPSATRYLPWAAAAALWLSPAGAGAQPQRIEVAFLVIQSVDGDDAFSRALSDAVRGQAERVVQWDLDRRNRSLAQMMLVHDCREASPACLQRIGQALEVDRILYGQVRRTSTAADYQFDLTLSLFDVEAARDAEQVSARLLRTAAEDEGLPAMARAWVIRLTGQRPVGRVRVVARDRGVPLRGATVFVDDRPVGETGRDGVLLAQNVEAGRRDVRVSAEGHAEFDRIVSVITNDDVEVTADLPMLASHAARLRQAERDGDRDTLTVAGIAALLGGATLVGVGLWAALRVDGLDDDPAFLRYREVVGQEVGAGSGISANADVCDLARDNLNFSLTGSERDVVLPRVRSVCDEADTLEVLQVVLLVAGVAALAAGGALLGRGLRSSNDDDDTSLRLRPTAGRDRAGLRLSGRF